MTPVLIACSHGTSSTAGRAAISAVVNQVRRALPGVPVAEAFVDVQEPSIDRIVADLPADATAIIIPLLLSTGFHTKVDIARAAGSADGRVIAAPALGPSPLLADLLAARLAAVALEAEDAVVLAAAGSSDPAASVDVAAMADLLRARVSSPVTVGFAAGAGTRIGEAVEAARRAGAVRVVVASYVLAPGHFADVIARSGADAVTAPLAPDEAIAAVIVERFEDARGAFRSAA